MIRSRARNFSTPGSSFDLLWPDYRTAGWGYSQFDDGKPLMDKAALQSCYDCHQAIKDRDCVFTRYAP